MTESILHKNQHFDNDGSDNLIISIVSARSTVLGRFEIKTIYNISG